MKSMTVVKWMVGFVVIGGGLTYFVVQAMQSSYSYYYTVDEFVSGGEQFQNASLRLAGKVKPGTVTRDIEKLALNFILTGAQAELPVAYTGTVPDNFTEDIEVVVQGRLDASGTFKAESVMTRCESKYKAKVE
ncbi:MAG: cytochrome c maturation protein CcmE [Phycisphaerae bacterium]|nr:cytochrome c maturation protein CcmE [Phycisphaerae bacterium]